MWMNLHQSRNVGNFVSSWGEASRCDVLSIQMNKWTVNDTCIFRQYLLLFRLLHVSAQSQQSSSGRGLKIDEKVPSCGRVTQGNVFKYGLYVSSDELKEMFLKFVNANMSTSNVAKMGLRGT